MFVDEGENETIAKREKNVKSVRQIKIENGTNWEG